MSFLNILHKIFHMNNKAINYHNFLLRYDFIFQELDNDTFFFNFVQNYFIDHFFKENSVDVRIFISKL